MTVECWILHLPPFQELWQGTVEATGLGGLAGALALGAKHNPTNWHTAIVTVMSSH